MIFVNIIVRVATLFVVDLICRRAGARRLVRLLAVACVAFFGEGYESLFAQSVMFAGFTLVFALLAVSESLRDDVSENRAGLISAAWLSASILSSSYGFPVVVGVALFYLLTHRRRAAVISFVIPPIVFLVIRGIAGGTYASQQPLSSNRLPLYIHYVQSGLAAVGDAILGMDGLGLVSFVIISVASLWLASTDRTRAFVISMIVAIVAFYFEASLSRSCSVPSRPARQPVTRSSAECWPCACSPPPGERDARRENGCRFCACCCWSASPTTSPGSVMAATSTPRGCRSRRIGSPSALPSSTAISPSTRPTRNGRGHWSATTSAS
jgi:hypothetical protein